MNRLKSHLNFLHIVKDAKSQARRSLLASASDDMLVDIVEYAKNTLNGNRELTKTKTANCKNMRILYHHW